MPANAEAIRTLLQDMSPALLGLKQGPFNNMKSLLRGALALAGRAVRSRARTERLMPEWEAIHRALPKEMKIGLGSCISYWSAKGWNPDEIGDQQVKAFAIELEAKSLSPKWRHVVTKSVNLWNKASESLVIWPKTRLSLPWPKKEPFTVPWENLPVPYRASVEQHLAFLADPPEDDDNAPLRGLRPESLKGKRFLLRYVASVLLRAG